MRMTHGCFGEPHTQQRPGAVTIGNFDGVHLGHQAMLARLTARAASVAGSVGCGIIGIPRMPGRMP